MAEFTVYANYDHGYEGEFIMGKKVEALTPDDAARERIVRHMTPADQQDVRRVLVVGHAGRVRLDNPRVFNVRRITQPAFEITPG